MHSTPPPLRSPRLPVMLIIALVVVLAVSALAGAGLELGGYFDGGDGQPVGGFSDGPDVVAGMHDGNAF